MISFKMLPLPRSVRLLLLVAAIVAGAGFWRWVVAPEAVARTALQSASAVPVETALAEPASLPVYLDALGTVQAFNTATITTRVDGELRKIGFTEGHDISAGDLLAQIDPRPYEAQLAQAEAKKAQDEAQLANGRRELERYIVLTPDNYTSKQTLDAARSQVAELTAQIKADDASLAAARTQLSYTTITAPFSGRTGLRLVDVGNIVHSNDPTGLVVIAQLQPISILFTVPQDELPALATAMGRGTVNVTAFARDGKTELDHGVVKLIDNRIDPSTGTVRLKAEFPNTDNRLWPGQFVSVRVLVQTLEDVLTVPSTAISQGPDGSFTYIVKPDDTVELRPLATGQDGGGATEIRAGLAAGERVVIGGQYRLQPGSHVQIDGAGTDPDPSQGVAMNDVQ